MAERTAVDDLLAAVGEVIREVNEDVSPEGDPYPLMSPEAWDAFHRLRAARDAVLQEMAKQGETEEKPHEINDF